MSKMDSGSTRTFLQSVLHWVKPFWLSIFPSTNIDDYPVEETRVAALSHRIPATPWGRELMTNAWPKLYEAGLTSETYLGCTAVLLTLAANLRSGMSSDDIVQKVIAVDKSLKNSTLFLPGSHRAAGAALTVTNAWERTRQGFSSEQLLIAFDSELIYAAKMFVAARESEKAGGTLR